MLRSLVVLFVLAVAACGSNQSSPSPQAPDPAPAPSEPAPTAKTMTADECTAAGGEVMGDIGDGAIHKPDYKCPKSGEAPLGHIKSAEGEPMGVEGAVCCR